MALTAPARGADPVAVLYVTEARLDSVAAYRIRGDGSIEARSFQRVSVGDNPRKLLATPSTLYVATKKRVEALRVAPETGRLSRFADANDHVIRPDAIRKAGFQYLAIDPEARYLYAAATRLDRILGYPLASDGSISEIGSCAQGPRFTRYQGLAATATTLYASASGFGRIHVFPLRESDGAIQVFATRATCKGGSDKGNSCAVDEQCRDNIGTCNEKGICASGPDQGMSCTVDSDCEDKVRICDKEGLCTGGPDQGNSCMNDSHCQDDSDCANNTCTCNKDRMLEVFSTCDRSTTTFPATSSGYLRIPRVVLLNQNSSTIYVTDLSGDRIIGCPIAEDGTLPDCAKRKFNSDVSVTARGVDYEGIALSPDDVLFASVFLNGTVRAFVLKEQDRLPRKPKKRHPSNIFSTPVGMAPYNGVLYVAQGDLNRVDAFRIDENGFRSARPFDHTAEVDRSFPNDVAVLPLSCAGCAQ